MSEDSEMTGRVVPLFEEILSVEPAPPRFKPEDFDTLEPNPMQWRVKGLWPRVGLCFVAGPSGCGKSFWVIDAMTKICRGASILGKTTKPGAVVYIASEGAEGVRNRIKGLRQKIGRLDGNFSFIGQAPDLTDAEDVEALKASLIALKDQHTAAGRDLATVVIDTLSASTPGADENTGRDMGPVLKALQTLAADLEVLVLMVSHTGKDEAKGLRGWSGLRGNADGLIMIESPDDEGVRKGLVTKVKDGPDNISFGFDLEVVKIGYDEDGEDQTTCVIREKSPPGKFDGVSNEDVRTIQAKVKEAEESGFPYKADSQSVDWVGWMVLEVLGIIVVNRKTNQTPEEAAAVKRVNGMVRTWLKNEVLIPGYAKDKSGHSRPIVSSGVPLADSVTYENVDRLISSKSKKKPLVT